jgi:subtilisin family serine protease
MKPEITAPGVNVMSCGLRGTYRALSGTSMASPAVNGAVALLWNAVPELKRKMKETMKVIYASATPMESTLCGSTRKVPNNLYGYGIINIEKAVDLALKEYRK